MNEQERRSVLGIVYCHVCKQDTMPCERTGICFWCSTQLVAVDDRKEAA